MTNEAYKDSSDTVRNSALLTAGTCEGYYFCDFHPKVKILRQENITPGEITSWRKTNIKAAIVCAVQSKKTFGSSENLQEYSELTKIIIQGKNHANSLLCIWD